MKKITIVDYGSGNVLSAQKSFIKITKDNNIEAKVLISKDLKNRFEIQLGITNIKWKNAGFDPTLINQNQLFSINKNSFNVGFSYNFDIATQTPKMHKDSIKKILTF